MDLSMHRPRGSGDNQSSPPNVRPSKRSRTATTDTTSTGQHDSGPSGSGRKDRLRTRAAVACATCRARKTKCDGRRPLCGYCERTNTICQYDGEDLTAFDLTSFKDMSSEVLHAINQLTQLIKEESRFRQPDTVSPGSGESFVTFPLGEGSNSALAVDHNSDQTTNLPTDLHTTPNRHGLHDPQLPTFSQGLNSVLEWHVFPAGIEPIRVDERTPPPTPEELPKITISELTRLQLNYRQVVHIVNPMLDISTLDQYITHISENGFDWTTRTCLVALVCAIGALCQDVDVFSPGNPPDPKSNDTDVAYRFWSIASKRLGRAMSYNTLESAQCLCLAGIWFMCNLQPLNAWKHFTMAGNCWYSAIQARSKSTLHPEVPDVPSLSQNIEQSVFYTIYKSELEIRYELMMHGSVLEHIEEQLVFPAPPAVNHAQLQSPNDELATWYFYLTDIAARHLINRIVNTRVKVNACPSESQVKALFCTHEIFEIQLEEWYQSIPPEISFQRPDASIAADPDPLKHILRSRYMFIRELLCRPFIQLCLNYHLDLPHETLDKVTAIATLGLQYCSWKLQASHKPKRTDQGVWIWIRNSTTSSMILIGAARSRQFPLLNAASRLWLPEDWHENVAGFVSHLEAYAWEKWESIADCIRLISLGLENLQPQVAMS
ncbi:hypothetical protein BU24DRAFT_455942 [Aaosphaeria arxii CBS 175.79]|uniref:Zn(2)-C6 fungal-type domain-containing protein n=1 Tax=Aaosphaeria arxii CBS 175.79 TaxID=1450172 RepID=A0A6A5X8E1_9PLEO|nr:uncharacterized protein BU24DRAFT_455942 [Aaosphaeria arxii CBS 175.79]KAF2009024.1 hypothetical protein BU24DRAFT_455942 [Aaosphaeria arxii CBS 175.79]